MISLLALVVSTTVFHTSAAAFPENFVLTGCTSDYSYDSCTVTPQPDGSYKVSVTAAMQMTQCNSQGQPSGCANFFGMRQNESNFTCTQSPTGEWWSIPWAHFYWNTPWPSSLTCTWTLPNFFELTHYCPISWSQCYLNDGYESTDYAGDGTPHDWNATFGLQSPAPTADFTYSTNSDGSIHFDASASTGDRLSYHWDFGPHVPAADTVSPTLDRSLPLGTTNVTLTVTDFSGHSVSVSHEVTIDTVLVNSAGDAADSDTTDALCSTGATVAGGAAECTLRAAIAQADATDGVSTIKFAIPGTPHITAATALPTVSRGLTIDGTTESGHWVELEGPGVATRAGIDFTDGTSTVRGFAIWNFKGQIVVDGGTDDVIAGNRLGTDSTGTVDHSVPYGIAVEGGTDLRIGGPNAGDANQIETSADGGGSAIRLDGGSATAVLNNLVNTTPDGAHTMGAGLFGISVFKGDTSTISGNTISAANFGVELRSGLTGGATVDGNQIGVTSTGQLLTAPSYGVLSEGAADVTVSNNTIDSRNADVSVAGRFATTADGKIRPPTEEDSSGPVTGTGDTVRGNTLGSGADGAPTPPIGVAVWDGATGATIADNTLTGDTDEHIWIIDGSGDSILDNRVGVSADGNHAASTLQANYGIRVLAADDVTIGAPDHANIIGNNQTGISIGPVLGQATDVHVVGNNIGVGINGTSAIPNSTGVLIGQAKDAILGGGNLIYFNPTGVHIEGSENTHVTANWVGRPSTAPAGGAGNEVGIDVSGGIEPPTGLELGPDDVIGGVDGDAVRIAQGKVTVTAEHIGITGGGTARTNSGYAIRVADGAHADVLGSEIADDTTGGVQSSGTGTAAVLHNSIHDVGGNGIESQAAPPAPTIDAAIPVAGQTPRLWVVLSGEPANSSEVVELFANHSCDAAQATTPVLSKTLRFGPSGRAVLVVKGQDSAAPHLTATASDIPQDVLRTSAISNCVDPAAADDSDGDGIPDVVEALGGSTAPNDPKTAVLPSDDGSLVALVTSVGKLTNVAPGDVTAAPPDGVTVQHLVSFAVTGVLPSQNVLVAVQTSDSGSTWWRYGPQTSGGAVPTWYAWPYDPQTGLGAEFLGPGNWVLHLRDGAFGDDDFTVDGTIHDPGGPAVVTSPTPTQTSAPPPAVYQPLPDTPTPTPSETSPTPTTAPPSTSPRPRPVTKPGIGLVDLPAYVWRSGSGRAVNAHWWSPGATSYIATFTVVTDAWGHRRAATTSKTVTTTATSTVLRPPLGSTLTVTVAGHNTAGTGPATSRSVIVPLDQTALHYSGHWQVRDDRRDWLGSDRRGAPGSRARISVVASRLILIGWRCPGCGLLAVSVDGHHLATLWTEGRATPRAILGEVDIPGDLRRHTVELTVKHRAVSVDALAVIPGH